MTWEHMTSLRLEGKNGSKGGKATFGRAENLSVWQLTRRSEKTKEAKENFEVTIQKDDPKKNKTTEKNKRRD